MATSMDNLLADLAKAPASQVHRGTIEPGPGGDLALTLGGVPVREQRWMPGYQPAEGDVVLAVKFGSLWTVLGAPAPEPVTPPPARGTVNSAPTGASRIGVSVSGHGTLLCPFLDSYTPSTGDSVMLLWPAGDGVPTVIGRPGEIPVPPPPPPEPPPKAPDPTPPPVQTGRERFSATDSGSARSATGWNPYFGRHVMQGAWSGPANTGFWFYGSRPRATLRGRTVTSARIRLGARRRVGNYNQSVTVQLRRHTSRTRPSGMPTLTGSTVSVTLPPGASARWVDLPSSWYSGLASGHGVALVGSAYAGIVGAGSGSGYDAQSGQLDIRWERQP